MAQQNRWHPVMLPDDYLRKLKRDLSEVEAQRNLGQAPISGTSAHLVRFRPPI
jgi:hypothetical protein